MNVKFADILRYNVDIFEKYNNQFLEIFQEIDKVILENNKQFILESRKGNCSVNIVFVKEITETEYNNVIKEYLNLNYGLKSKYLEKYIIKILW